MKENSHHVGVQRDRSFYDNLHEMSDILIMLLIGVELDKIPLLHKLKQLYKCLSVLFFLNWYRTLLMTYYTSCTPRGRFISSIRNCDHMMKMLYKKQISLPRGAIKTDWYVVHRGDSWEIGPTCHGRCPTIIFISSSVTVLFDSDCKTFFSVSMFPFSFRT